MNWRDLHDATLEKVHINWETKTCEFEIGGDGVDWLVRVKNFSDLQLPRSEPWGPSSSINNVVQEGGELKIEMQSGDTLIAIGDVETVQSS